MRVELTESGAADLRAIRTERSERSESAGQLIEQDFRILYEVFADRVEIFGIISARRDVFGESEPPTE